jgi:AmmeMemoRadiSam system protein A
MTSEAERAALLRLARAAVEASVRGQVLRPPPDSPIYARRAGAFVTLTLDRALRGCIGYPGRDLTLADVVAQCSEGACLRDPRFPAVEPEELSRLRIELSVLGELEWVSDVGRIEVGRHGLVIEEGERRGLLLPQVPIEHGWSRETFLAQLSLKAGLNRDAWRGVSARLFMFEAEVFGEPHVAGPTGGDSR